MTDEQLTTYLGIPSDHPMKATVIRALSPEKRATYERMASIETELELWQAGLGPRPNIMIDTERSTSRRRAWR